MASIGTLRVLGSCGGFPEAGRACNGFLLTYNSFSVVLDMGYGTYSRLLEARPNGDVDCVVITHEHPDHFIDLHALFRRRLYGPARTTRIGLYCPPGVLDRLSGLEPDADLREVFDVFPLPGSYRLGPFDVSGHVLQHHVENVGVRLEAVGLTLAYTGDTAPVGGLVELGADADLYIVDATNRPGETSSDPRNLMTAGEAGYWAARAGAKRLLLTHFWPGTDRDQAVREACEHFTAPVIAADEGLTIQLP